MSVQPPFSVERIILEGPQGQIFKALAPPFCLKNPSNCCSGSGVSGDGLPIRGHSSEFYTLTNEYQIYELPAGSVILDQYCTRNPVCCTAPSQGSVGSGCGPVRIGRKPCPGGLPKCIAVTITGTGTCACLSGTYICEYNLGESGFWSCLKVPQTCNPAFGTFNIVVSISLDGTLTVFLGVNPNPENNPLVQCVFPPGSWTCCPISGSQAFTMTPFGNILCADGGTIAIAPGDCSSTSGATGGYDGIDLINEYIVVQLPPGWKIVATGCEDRPDCSALCVNSLVEISCCGTAKFEQGLFVLIESPGIPLIDGQTVAIEYADDVFSTGKPGWVSSLIPVPVPGASNLSMLIVVGCPDLISTWVDCPDASGLQILVAVGDPSNWGSGPVNPSCFYLCCSIPCPPQNEDFILDSCTSNPVLGPNAGTNNCPDTVNGSATLWLLS